MNILSALTHSFDSADLIVTKIVLLARNKGYFRIIESNNQQDENGKEVEYDAVESFYMLAI